MGKCEGLQMLAHALVKAGHAGCRISVRISRWNDRRFVMREGIGIVVDEEREGDVRAKVGRLGGEIWDPMMTGQPIIAGRPTAKNDKTQRQGRWARTG